MENYPLRSLTGRKHPRVQEEESMLASEETRKSSPTQSHINLLKEDTKGQRDERDTGDQDRTPRSRNPLARLESWIDRLLTSYQKRTWSMYLFLILGTVFAVGHHLFYWHLHGKEAKKQSLMLRYGTILAFCAKASLGTAVILARRQRVWMALRQRIARLGTVDSIFTAAEDITALFDWRAVKKAKVATCLAIYVWVTPLIVVLTSETLSVVGGVKEERGLCPEARTLNFSNEGTLDWRSGLMFKNIYENSLSLWNTTNLDDFGVGKANDFDYWTGSSMQCRMFVERIMYLQQVAVRKNAAREICTEAWNCSYVVEFKAPGYKCTELATGVRSDLKKLDGALPPFDTRSIVPEGDYSYLAVADLGEYALQQYRNTSLGGMPQDPPPWPKHLGAFRTEPVIWIGYATVDDYSKIQPINNSVKGWNESYTPVIIGCEHYEISYKVEFNYTNGIQSYTIKRRKYLSKVINTKYTPDKVAHDGTMDKITAIPEDNYILPSNPGTSPERFHKYHKVAAYHSLGKVFRGYLNGTVTMPYYIANTDILKTKLMTLPNYLPEKDLHKRIPELYEEIVMSLLSSPAFIAVSWASNASAPSGSPLGGNKTNFPCLRSKPTTFFLYKKAQLCLVYSISITIAMVGVLLGAQAAHQEGRMRDVKPSSILQAATAQSLTEARPASDQDFRDVKVGFGLVQEYTGENVQGFGLAGHVIQEDRRPRWPFWRPGPRREVPPEN
jgi:hypothetical protein